MTGNFDEYHEQIDSKRLQEELDAEHFGQSVRERIDIAVRTKAERWRTSRYFYDMIEDAAYDFLHEGQQYPENISRYSEISVAYDELYAAFEFIIDYIKEDRSLDGAIRDLMWSSFLIGLACDRERLDNQEILKKYISEKAHIARMGKSKKGSKWKETVFKATCEAIPVAQKASWKYRKLTGDRLLMAGLKTFVRDVLVRMKVCETLEEAEKELSVTAVRTAVLRYLKGEN